MGSVETKIIETTILNKETSDNTRRLHVISSAFVTIFELEGNLIGNISLRLVLFEVISKNARKRINKLTCHCIQKIPSDARWTILHKNLHFSYHFFLKIVSSNDPRRTFTCPTTLCNFCTEGARSALLFSKILNSPPRFFAPPRVY